MISWANVGAKCVCINDDSMSFWAPGYSVSGKFLVRKGQTYTIRSVEITPDGKVGIKLVGVQDRSRLDYGYAVERFRPLVVRTQEQDVEMFKRLVDRVPNMETAQ